MRFITLQQFIDGWGRDGGERVYSAEHHMMLYVYRHHAFRPSLRIGVMDIPPNHQQKGYMTKLLEELMNIPVRIENVCNTSLENYLLKNKNWFCEDLAWIGLSTTFHNEKWKESIDDYHRQDHLRQYQSRGHSTYNDAAPI